MPPIKKLPKPRTRYYVDQPVVVVPLADLERIVTHMVRMGLKESYDPNVQRGLKSRHTLILRECWAMIRQAKAHYKIPEK